MPKAEPTTRTSRPSGRDARTARELDVARKVGELHDVDFGAMEAVANVYRVASAVRNHMERDVLGPDGLSWTGFTALFVLWVWGPQEARRLATECGVTKGTLSGIVATLEGRGLLARMRDPEDGRQVVIELTRRGRTTIRRLYPTFNRHEVRVTAGLTRAEQRDLARLLRKMLVHVEATQ